MFIEKLKSSGLAHLSYLFGSNGCAAVIDPRRDCDVYIDMAAERGCRITHIFETHRNEDLLSGSAVLARRTGAGVYHGPNPAGPVAYAETTREGDSFDIGVLRVRVLETPGHTDDSLSFAVLDTDSSEDVLAVFTGDALFCGDVGRTDFYPERAREVAGLLFDSLRKLEALGDHVVIYPAHGAGSVCGSGMADREVSTIGYERLSNERFAMTDRDAFIDAKVSEHHERPPYFAHMEAGNLAGAAPVRDPLGPTPLSGPRLEELRGRVTLVDVRSAAAYLGAHLPDSLALPTDLISAFAGWFLAPDEPIALVAEDAAQAGLAARHLARIGIDAIEGFLEPSLVAWAASGSAFATLPVVDATTVSGRIEKSARWTLLDVRGAPEVAQMKVASAQHIYVGDLAAQLDTLDRSRAYTVMCGSGARATIAASLLLRAGFSNVDLFLGSMGAWRKAGYATE